MRIDAVSGTALCVAAAEFSLGAAALAAGVRGARPAAGDDPGGATRRAVLGGRLAVVAVVALPLLYAILRGAVAEWPGVMCVRGVLRAESSGGGGAAWLPAALAVAVASRGALLVALVGSKAIAAADLRTHDGALGRAAAGALAAGGTFAVAAAVATAVYIGIPRVPTPPASGCCTVVLGDGPSFADDPSSSADDGTRAMQTALFVGAAALAAASAGFLARRQTSPGATASAGAALASAAAVVAWGRFLGGSLAPARLGLPFHECVPCLLDHAPETWAGVALVAAAFTCAAAALVVAAVARPFATAAEPVVRGLLGAAAFTWTAALLFFASARWLA